MRKHSFTKGGINYFAENVYDESFEKIANVMQEINETDNKITKEQNAQFDKIYNSIAINISIGSNSISIPNNANNIETIMAAIKECFEQTL